MVTSKGVFQPGGQLPGGGLVVAGETGPNLIVNGSFEEAGPIVYDGSWGRGSQTIPGWTKNNSQPYEEVVSGYQGIAATDGAYWLDMGSGGGSGSDMDISQTISGLAAGQILSLHWDHSNGPFKVLWNGVELATLSHPGNVLRSENVLVTAVAGDNVLQFVSLTGGSATGASLDNVRLYATIPLPPVSGTIVRGTQGVDITYDGAGQRATATSSRNEFITGNFISIPYVRDYQERYSYTADGYLDTTRIATSGFAAPLGEAIVSATDIRDALGRVLEHNEFSDASPALAYSGSWGRATATIPGWSKTNAQAYEQVLSGYQGIAATDGDYWLDMGSGGGSGSDMDISQTVRGLSAGQVLSLHFDHTNGPFKVLWNGVEIATLSHPGNVLRSENVLVTALAGNNVLRFVSLAGGNAVGASLDNVRLYATDSQSVETGSNLITNGSFELIGTPVYTRTAVYNDNSQVVSDRVVAAGTTSETSYNYGVNGLTYAGGAVVSQTSTSTTAPASGGAAQTTTSVQTNTYVWRDSALQKSITNVQSGAVNGTTTSSFAYNANGHLTSVNVTGQQARRVDYTVDAAGQIMVRSQTNLSPNPNAAAPNSANTAPRQHYFYLGGQQIGEIGNDGTDNTDYATAIARNSTADGTGMFREGATTGTSYADFDQNYAAINTSAAAEAGAASSYTVRQGDTLASIARAVWGDASLWYLLAEANGLTTSDSVAAGQTLSIPAKVTNFHNSADTFHPYDAGRAIGDVQPGAPTPPKAKKACGGFGQILGLIISLVVAAVLPGVGTAIGKALGGVIGGTVGAGLGAVVGAGLQGALVSTVSQGIGSIVGLQDGINWKGVALAGVTAGVGQGLGELAKLRGPLGTAGKFLARDTFVSNVARGITANVLTQGIGKLTGLQDKFDWAGVAAAGIVSGVGGHVGAKLGKNGFLGIKAAEGSFGNTLISGMAGGIAGAGTRSLIEGTNFGDNVLAVLPDVIGNAIGNAVAKEVIGIGKPSLTREEREIAKALKRGDFADAKLTTAQRNNTAQEIVRAARLDGNATPQEILARLTATASARAATIRFARASVEAITEGYVEPPIADSSALQTLEEITVFGPTKGSYEYKLAISQDFLSFAAGDDGGNIKELTDQLSAGVRDARLQPASPTPLYGAQSVDNVVAGTGQVLEGISQTLDRNPWAKWGLEAASLAAGPAQYAIGKAFGAVTEPVIGEVAEASAERAAGLGNSADRTKALANGTAAITSLAIGLVIGPAKFQSLFTSGLARVKGALDGIAAKGTNLFQRLAAERASGALTSIGRNRVTFQGLEVRAVRDLSHVDDATLAAMSKKGFAPELPNGESIVLHHHRQNPAGFIVELPTSKHSIGNVNQHPFGNTPGSGLTAQQRADFNVWRGDYWRARAQAEIQRRASGQ